MNNFYFRILSNFLGSLHLKYAASVSAGTKNGQIKVSYNISSRGVASSIGISSIKIYVTGEGCKATILGTTSNGLLANNTAKKAGTYTYSGVSGTSYYAVVTFTATVNGTSDWVLSRFMRKNVCRARLNEVSRQ